MCAIVNGGDFSIIAEQRRCEKLNCIFGNVSKVVLRVQSLSRNGALMGKLGNGCIYTSYNTVLKKPKLEKHNSNT